MTGPVATRVRSDKRLVRDVLSYLRIVPTDTDSIRRLITGYLTTVHVLVRNRSSFGSVGRYIPGASPIGVWVDGFRAYIRPGTEDLGHIILSHEPGVSPWFSPKRGELVIDVGAHIGAYTLRAARVGAKVVAIEPTPSTFEVLRRNVCINGFSSVRLVNCALSNRVESRTLTFDTRELGRASLVGRAGDCSVTVNCLTLDSIFAQDMPLRVDWLKVDVEGMELEVLSGARAVLERTRRLIVEVQTEHLTSCRQLLLDELDFVMARRAIGPGLEYWFLLGQIEQVR